MLTDIKYALAQLKGCAQCQTVMCVSDRVQRAIDALERLEEAATMQLEAAKPPKETWIEDLRNAYRAKDLDLPTLPAE